MNIFVISNSAISERESNGRVLKSILPNIEKNNFLNFYLRGIPEKRKNFSYLHVSDLDAVKSFLTLGVKKPKNHIQYDVDDLDSAFRGHKAKKPFHYFIRNLAWNSSFYKTYKIRNIIDNFKPDVIYLMASDTPFLYKLARIESNKKNIPLIIYSAEDYPLKKYDYIKQKEQLSFWSKKVISKLYKEAKKAFSQSANVVFNSKDLMNAYVKEGFIAKGEVIPLPSTFRKCDSKGTTNKNLLYTGNLNYERCTALIEIADVLSSFENDFILDVYGLCDIEECLKQFNEHRKIEYHGLIEYAELSKVIQNSRFLVIAEGFSSYNKINFKYSFSTKIADYLLSNKPLVVFGDPEICSIKYLKSIFPGNVFVSKSELTQNLPILIQHSRWNNDKYSMIQSIFGYNNVNKKITELFLNATNNEKI